MAAVALLGVGMLVLGAFLRSQRLERADQFASVVGVFLNFGALVLGLLAWRGS